MSLKLGISDGRDFWRVIVGVYRDLGFVGSWIRLNIYDIYHIWQTIIQLQLAFISGWVTSEFLWACRSFTKWCPSQGVLKRGSTLHCVQELQLIQVNHWIPNDCILWNSVISSHIFTMLDKPQEMLQQWWSGMHSFCNDHQILVCCYASGIGMH